MKCVIESDQFRKDLQVDVRYDHSSTCLKRLVLKVFLELTIFVLLQKQELTFLGPVS